jgi:SAM-dependent methyltransferase
VDQRVDFSANAPIYDRRHGTVLPDDIARLLAENGALATGACVLDVAAGTGRAAIAFANIGYPTTALDSSLQMLKEVRTKAPGSRVRLVVGEGGRLPFTEGQFDAVILARVLYLMPDWRSVLQAVSEALKPGGRLFHEWGNGEADESWVQIREKLRALCQDAGIPTPFHPGARSEADIDIVLERLGFFRVAGVALGPGPKMTLRDFLECIVSGEFSYIWNVPSHVQTSCIPVLRKWCEDTFDLTHAIPIPRALQWSIYRKEK